MDQFNCLSPLDYRYYDPAAAQYLSEEAFTRYKLKVEAALAYALYTNGVCPEEAKKEIEGACALVETAEVYDEEDRIKHDIRALANCIRNKVSPKAQPFVHLTATSFDIIDTANAARFRDVTLKVALPTLVSLLQTLIDLAEREAETVQVGRTHGQHATPVTFGFVIANYVDRLGSCLVRLQEAAESLFGKFSGATGTFAAIGLMVDHPIEFEDDVMLRLALRAAPISTQIVPPEPMIRLLDEYGLAMGVMGNIARDMRNLQRSEIAEVGEDFGGNQVGSSTMPQKRNPINFENVESLWKEVIGRLVTVHLDQISEHQRDLTGSASSRTRGEIVAYVISAAKRLNRTMKKLQVDEKNMKRNLELGKGAVLAEALHILLAKYGHPDSHEAVRLITLRMQQYNLHFTAALTSEPGMSTWLQKMSETEREMLVSPEWYIGRSVQQTRSVCRKWRDKLLELGG